MELVEWIQEWAALVDTRETAAVADCRRSLAAVRETLGPTAFQEYLGREMTESEEDRQRWEQQMWAALHQIRRSEPSIEAIGKFRRANKENFDQLRSEEMKILHSLADGKALEEKFDSWLVNTPMSSTPGSRSSQTPTATIGNDNPAVSAVREALTALELEIERDGGATGGWDTEEHSVFLRGLSKSKEELQALLPQLAPEEIEKHKEWYVSKHLPRQALKKRLLADWRAERDAQVARNRATQSVNVDLEAEAAVKLKMREEAKLKKAETDAQLEAWRAEKAEKEEQELLDRRRKEALKRAIEAEDAKERARARAEVLARYKEEKKKIQEELKSAAMELSEREKQERQLAISATKPRIEQRSESNAARLRMLQEAKREGIERRQVKQALLTEGVREAIASKVSSRVHEKRQTNLGEKEEQEIAVERFLDRFGGRRSLSMGGRAVHVPTLSVPSWRKGLN